MFLDGENVTELIRTPEVSLGASDVGKIPGVRRVLTSIQRDFAMKNNVVMEGRDIGSFVLTDANYKFFLTASLKERARRRYEELSSKGSDVTFDEVKKDIEYRDINDSQRKIAPLVKASDAIVIDSTNMQIDDVVKYIIRLIKPEMQNG